MAGARSREIGRPANRAPSGSGRALADGPPLPPLRATWPGSPRPTPQDPGRSSETPDAPDRRGHQAIVRNRRLGWDERIAAARNRIGRDSYPAPAPVAVGRRKPPRSSDHGRHLEHVGTVSIDTTHHSRSAPRVNCTDSYAAVTGLDF